MTSKWSEIRITLHRSPVVASADDMVVIDVLLTCEEHRLVVIDFLNLADVQRPEVVQNRKDDLYTSLNRELLEYKPLADRRALRVEINVMTFVPADDLAGQFAHLPVAGPQTLLERPSEFRPIDPQVLKLVNAAKSPGSHPCPRSHTHRPCGRARAGIVRLPRTRAIRETYEHKLQVRTVHQRTLWLLPGTGSNFEVIMSGDS